MNKNLTTEIKQVLAADKCGEKISLQVVCKLCEDMTAIPMHSLTLGQRSYHGRYLSQLRTLRDKIVDSIQENQIREENLM